MTRTITPEHRAVREKLLQLRRFVYFARYGDYFAHGLAPLKAAGLKRNPQSFKTYWTAMAKKLKKQEFQFNHAGMKAKRDDFPDLFDFWDTAESIPLNRNQAWFMVMQYAERNSIMHGGIEEFIKDCKFFSTLKLETNTT